MQAPDQARDDHRDTLVTGALVRWAQRPGYGVIAEVGAASISVRWDEPGAPTQFKRRRPPLSRVALAPGHVVKLRSTGETAAVLSLASPAPPVWQTFVTPLTGPPPRTLNVPETDLRPVPIIDPVERFKSGNIGSLRRYRLRDIAQWYRELHLNDDLVSLGQVGVDLKPHQVAVVHRVISEYPHRFLLCDEVGLGKTIEAGMVLKELRARGGAERVLAIVPPNLLRQWQFEMKSKFNERFSVLNSATVAFLKNQGFDDNPFTYSDSVLCSSRWIAHRKWAPLCAAVDWDLVIVDEAHHVRSRRNGRRVQRTRLYHLVRELAPTEHLMRGMLFLTATPLQLDAHELYSLVELLDPTLFASEEHFERHRKAVPGLSLLVERLLHHGFPLPQEEPDTTTRQVARWLDLGSDEARRRLDDAAAHEQLAADLSARHLLSRVLIRNRKAVVGGFMPRQAYRWRVELTAPEHAALRAVTAYVEFGFKLAEAPEFRAIGLVMVIYQKLMSSSVAAVRLALRRRREKILKEFGEREPPVDIEAWLDDDGAAADALGQYHVADEAAAAELSLLDDALAALGRVAGDSKARVLAERLDTLVNDQPDAKVLVFTEFRETQRYLRELLSGRGWGINLFHGQLSADEKDHAVARFRDGGGPQLLISTEAGGEGRNLQFCHLLVNYDLPWNPMRIEQRIGRLDRIGQEHVVSIFNFDVKDTIEQRILEVLEHRIGVFQETVGGLDPILGDTEQDIRRIMRLAAAKRRQAFAELGRRLERQIVRARQAGRQLGDFIMDTKSFRREIAERVAGRPSPIDSARFERFIAELLVAVGTYVKRSGDGYQVTFHGEFRETHGKLLAGGARMAAVFGPDRPPDAESIEIMAFGHPIIEAIVARVLEDGYDGTTGTRRIRADQQLAPVSGWLFAYQFTVPGVRTSEHLVPVLVSDAGRVDAQAGRRIMARGASFDKEEQEIDQSRIPANLDNAALLANDFANTEQQKLQQDAERRADDRVDQEVARIAAWFDYRERVARDRVAATRATLHRLRTSDDDAARRILPVWEANLQRDQELPGKLAAERHRRIAAVEKFRHPQVAWALKSLGRIEVVPDG